MYQKLRTAAHELRTAALVGTTALAGIGGAALIGPTAANAGGPARDQATAHRLATTHRQATDQHGSDRAVPSRDVAYTRDGAIYVSQGAGERRLTGSDGNDRPRWSPDGRLLAYTHGGELWQMTADGGGKHLVTPGRAAGAAYSPDGRWLAYSAPACVGGPGVYRVKATAPHGAPEVLFPAECRERPVPAPTAPTGRGAGALAERLRYDDAVAWSPDGAKIAFRGGECESVYDNCLTIGTVAAGTERTIAAFGGGGDTTTGFAVVPAWSPDGKKIAWTASPDGATVRVIEAASDNGRQRQVGAPNDRELAYADATHAAVTAQHQGHSWVMWLDLNTGTRTPFRQGSQPAVRP